MIGPTSFNTAPAMALKRFAANEYKRGQRQKRGGGSAQVSIDSGDAERRYAEEMATGLAPDLLFERRWALTLLNTVLAKLREEYARDGRADLFDALKDRVIAVKRQRGVIKMDVGV